MTGSSCSLCQTLQFLFTVPNSAVLAHLNSMPNSVPIFSAVRAQVGRAARAPVQGRQTGYWLYLEKESLHKKSFIWETLNLLRCVDCSTDTKTVGNKQKRWRKKCILCYVSCLNCPVSSVMCYVLCVMCHVAHVTCHVSPVACPVSSVTCHMSPVINANSHSHRPSPWVKLPHYAQ